MLKNKLIILLFLISIVTTVIFLSGCVKEIQNYEVKLNDEPEEAGSIEGAGNFEQGEEVTLEAEPEEGYEFSKWLEDGEEISTDENYRFEINSDRKLTAEFVKKEYEVEVSERTYPINHNIGESVEAGSVIGGGTYEHGEEVVVEAEPEEGFVFKNWTIDGEEVSTEKTYKFKAKNEKELSANFDAVIYDKNDEILLKHSEIIEQLEKEWETMTDGKKVHLKGGKDTINPSFFSQYMPHWSLSPDKDTIAFILGIEFASHDAFSVPGYYEPKNDEFIFIRLLRGIDYHENDKLFQAAHENSKPKWSKSGDYFAYTVSDPVRGPDVVLLIDGMDGQRISIGGEYYVNFEGDFTYNDEKHILIDNDSLRKKIETEEQIEVYGEDFSFRDLKWSENVSTLYFTVENNDRGKDKEFVLSFDMKTEELKLKE